MNFVDKNKEYCDVHAHTYYVAINSHEFITTPVKEQISNWIQPDENIVIMSVSNFKKFCEENKCIHF